MEATLESIARGRRATEELHHPKSGVARAHGDGLQRHVEFFRHDLSERRPNARSEVDMSVEGGDRTIGCYMDEGFDCGVRA